MKTLKEVLVKNLANDKIIDIYMNYEHRNELSTLAMGTASDLMKVLSQHFQQMSVEKVMYGKSQFVAVIIKVGVSNGNI